MSSALPFSPTVFVQQVGEHLVMEFHHSAVAGTPGLIGSAKEHPARKQLERLLPHSAAIGSGLVIDSYGGVSKQQDIVIFDRSTCPVFSVNETPEATYYPCEGVIAVGEIKSSMGTREIEDSFAKIASVKRLRRHAVVSLGLAGSVAAFRSYGSVQSLMGTADEQFDQERKPTDQVFGFVLCGNFSLIPSTTHSTITKLWKHAESEAPNVIVSLRDGFLAPVSGSSLSLSAQDATEIAYCKQPERGLPFLVDRLSWVVRNGRTVEISSFQRYFRADPDKPESYTTERMPL